MPNDIGGRDAMLKRAAPERTTVLVVGGGPVGLAAAAELAHWGVESVLVEPRLAVDMTRPRAKTTSIRTMELFRRWGWVDRLRTAAPIPVSWSQSVSFCDTVLGREVTRFDDCFGLYSAPVDFASEVGQQVPQPIVEQVLRQAVDERSECVELFGWRVCEIEQRSDHVLAQLVTDDGRSAQIEAEYVVGCDGARSFTRSAIGARMEGEADERSNLGVVFRSPGLWPLIPHDPAVQFWVVNRDCPALVGRFDLDDMWWMIALGVDRQRAEPLDLIRRAVGSEIDAEIVSTDPWTSKMLVASTFRHDRVFLAGDAAHLNPPFGGHGFNTGIGDAVNVGWKLAAVVRGWGGPGLLDSYEAERRAVARRTVEAARANMAVLAGDLAPAVGDSCDVADRIRRSKDAEFHSLGLVLGYSYDSSPVIVHSDGVGSTIDESTTSDPAEAGVRTPSKSSDDVTRYRPSGQPGARLPHHWLSPGVSVYDAIETDFAIVTSARHEALAHSLRAAAHDRSVPITTISVSDDYLDRFASGDSLLVRPDHHICWRGTSVDDPYAILDTVRGG